MKSLLNGILLAFTLLCSPALMASDNEVAFAGQGFGKFETKSIIEEIVGRIPDTIQYVDCGDFIPADDFKNFKSVVLATALSRAYTSEEAAIIESYIRQGGRLVLIHQAYRNISHDSSTPKEAPHFESWLGKGRTVYIRDEGLCTVNAPDDPLLKGVFRKTAAPEWLKASILLRNPDFDNLIGHEDKILVGRKRIGEGAVYFLGSEFFRMKLKKYPERHADAGSWALLIENILTDRRH